MFEDCPKSQLLLIIELEIYAESGLAETYQENKGPSSSRPLFSGWDNIKLSIVNIEAYSHYWLGRQLSSLNMMHSSHTLAK